MMPVKTVAVGLQLFKIYAFKALDNIKLLMKIQVILQEHIFNMFLNYQTFLCSQTNLRRNMLLKLQFLH